MTPRTRRGNLYYRLRHIRPGFWSEVGALLVAAVLALALLAIAYFWGDIVNLLDNDTVRPAESGYQLPTL